MQIIDTAIPDVKILQPKKFDDNRGYFMETWNQKEFEEKVTGKPTRFVQDNQSMSTYGVLRGLHYQKENIQGKLVRVISGEVFDVGVDIRKGSPTYGQWVGARLSAENALQLWLPEGFAHGFCVLSSTAEFVYKCTDFYNPNAEGSIIWNDSTINIKWPEIEGKFNLSEKDKKAEKFSANVFLKVS